MSTLPTSWEPPNRVPTAVVDRLLDAIYPNLNELHGVRESRRFWAILLHRYIRRCAVATRTGTPVGRLPGGKWDDDAVLGPKLAGTRPPPRDTRGASAGWTRRVALSALTAAHRFRERVVLRQLSSTSLKDSRSILGQFHGVDVVMRYIDRPTTWWTAAIRPSMIDSVRAKRDGLMEMVEATDWPLARLTLEWLPPSYVEEFDARNGIVEVVTPERKIVHTGFLADVQSRFVTARYVAAGARLRIYQHGSGYGEIEDFELHDTESFMADEFMTWGWRIRANDVPFLALRFMRPPQERLRPKTGRSEWLYVNQRSTFPWEVRTTLDIQDRFFGGLTESVAKQGVLRPRMEKGGGWGSQISERTRRMVLHVDDGASNFNELASSMKLVVFDAFPSTSFLECLQAGQPAIVIASEPVEFSKIVKPIYDEFIQMGLLHLTPESAAEFVNGLPVAKWWKSIEKNRGLREYVRMFCRTRLTGPRS